MNKWLDDEIDFLKNNYGKMLSIDIAKHVNKKQTSVIQKAFSLGLKSSLKKFDKNASFRHKIIQKGILPVKSIDSIISGQPTEFICKYCGSEFTTTPYKIASGHTKSCGCVSIGNRTGGIYISSTVYSHIKNNAFARNLEFALDINFLDDLLKNQNFKCAISGQELIYGYHKMIDITCSLDRIDSSKGYTKCNVQWVHKNINMAKQGMTQKDFIQMCKDVTKYNGY